MGLSINTICGYSGDPTITKQPEQHIALTASEIKHLHALRKVDSAAYEALDGYEAYLFRVHRVRKPDVQDHCYYFVGIRFSDDYITVDPNPMFADEECSKIDWRLK